MSWQEEIDELAPARAGAPHGRRGQDRAPAQGGTLTVRERIEQLLDAASFPETGSLAGKATYDKDGKLESFLPANFVLGTGRIDGRPSSSAATTSPCAAAPPTRRSPPSR